MKRVASVVVPVISISRQASKPLHRQIYDGYRSAIVEGRLRPGHRIPSTRVLASELGVSRFPVLNAHAQLLAEGYFESRVGAGTVVSGSLPDQFISSKPTQARFAAARSGLRLDARRSSKFRRLESSPWLRGWGPFGVGQVAFDQFPLHTWTNLVARRCRSLDAGSFHYGDQ